MKNGFLNKKILLTKMFISGISTFAVAALVLLGDKCCKLLKENLNT